MYRFGKAAFRRRDTQHNDTQHNDKDCVAIKCNIEHNMTV
jgi:hypothetical protein